MESPRLFLRGGDVVAQRCPGYLLDPMAAISGLIAAFAELPRSFRHIDSADARARFVPSHQRCRQVFEWAGAML